MPRKSGEDTSLKCKMFSRDEIKAARNRRTPRRSAHAQRSLVPGEELHTDRLRCRNGVADRVKRTSLLINFKNSQRVRILVRRDQVFTGGIDAEITRRFAAR